MPRSGFTCRKGVDDEWRFPLAHGADSAATCLAAMSAFCMLDFEKSRQQFRIDASAATAKAWCAFHCRPFARCQRAADGEYAYASSRAYRMVRMGRLWCADIRDDALGAVDRIAGLFSALLLDISRAGSDRFHYLILRRDKR